MKAAARMRWRSVALPLGTALAVALLWEAAARGSGVPAYFFPPLSAVLREAWNAGPFLVQSVLRTFVETGLGFIAGTAFGILCGIAFALLRPLERAFFPLFVVSQTIPVVAFGALVIIWFGNTIFSKVVIAFYLTFFPVTVNTHRGMLSVDPQKIQLMRAFGASAAQIFWKLRFPAALPTITVALRLGISLSLIGAIVGEWFGDTVGLGVMLIQAMYAESVPGLWSLIITCGLLGASLYAVVAVIEQRVVWWRADT
jgi:NitT/TauT family transport system permease protein